MNPNRNEMMAEAFSRKQAAAMRVAARFLAREQEAAQTRPISEIAAEIARDWRPVNFAAKPYLDAMFQLDKITDMYGQDPADMVVRYFLGNATSWRGEKAKAIKTELKAMLKR